VSNGDAIEIPEVTVQAPSPSSSFDDRFNAMSGRITTSGPPGVASLSQQLGLDHIDVGGTSFYRVAKPPYLTRAVIVVDGVEYYEWLTVEVHLEVNGTPPSRFKFTCTEQEEIVGGERITMAALRIRPPDKCMIFLDGYLVITGFVTTRQVYYDGNTHQIEIQGMGQSGKLSQAPAVSQTGEFKQQNLMQIAQALAGKAGVDVKQKGSLDNSKFPMFRTTPGESAGEAIEKLQRMTGAFKSEDPMGAMVLFGDYGGGGGFLIEGYNIITGLEVIHTLMQSQGQSAFGQGLGGDGTNYAQSNQGNATNNSGENTDEQQAGMAARTLTEIPFFNQALGAMRAKHESTIGNENMITVRCKVLGWEKEGGGLWWPGDMVFVDSPMLIMKRQLKIKSVTFSQSSDGGTTTDVEAVNKLSKNEEFVEG